MKNKFKKTLFLQHYVETDGSAYLVANENEEDAVENDLGTNTAGKRVGIYELKEVVTIEGHTTYTRRKAK